MNLESISNLSTVGLVGAGVGGTLLYKCWDTIKDVFNFVISIFIVTIRVDGQQNIDIKALTLYITDNYKSLRYNVTSYTIANTFVKPTFCKQEVLYRKIVGPAVFHKGFRFFWITGDSDNYCLTFHCIRGLFNSDKFMCDVVDYYNLQKKSGIQDRFYIRNVVGKSKVSKMDFSSMTNDPPSQQGGHRSRGHDSSEDFYKFNTPVKYQREQLGQFKNMKGNYIPCSSRIQKVMKDCIEWKNDEGWYRARCVPWKKGYLFVGKPGTGKTSLVCSLGEELDFPIWLFDLGSLSNEEFIQNWNEMANETPCIAVFEDMDNAFKGRQNITKKEDGLTFDCLLNCIDGVKNSEGIITIVTTNVRESMDAAICAAKSSESDMASRPGRIDEEIEFVNPDKDHMLEFCKRILPEDSSKWDSIIVDGLRNNDTSCQFQSRCVSLAKSLKDANNNVQKIQNN